MLWELKDLGRTEFSLRCSIFLALRFGRLCDEGRSADQSIDRRVIIGIVLETGQDNFISCGNQHNPILFMSSFYGEIIHR